MRLRSVHIVVSAALLVALCGCGRGRVIPAEKLTRIYHDMYLADQWLRDNPEARKVADTTLFFDPIFRSHGYSFEDFDRTVRYYLDHPDKYAKIISKASDRLRKEGERMQHAADELAAREYELNQYRKGYRQKDFSTDSLRWSGPETLWPVYVDSTKVARDSTALSESEPEALSPAGSDTWEVIKPAERVERDKPQRIRIEDLENEEMKK